MTVSGFFEESLVLENDEEYTEAPSSCLDKIEEAKALNAALVYKTGMFRTFWLRHNQRYVSNTG